MLDRVGVIDADAVVDFDGVGFEKEVVPDGDRDGRDADGVHVTEVNVWVTAETERERADVPDGVLCDADVVSDEDHVNEYWGVVDDETVAVRDEAETTDMECDRATVPVGVSCDIDTARVEDHVNEY